MIRVGDFVRCECSVSPDWEIRAIYRNGCALGDLAHLVADDQATVHYEPVANLTSLEQTFERTI